MLICFKHRCEMLVVAEPRGRFPKAPLRRCPVCTAEYREALKKALALPHRHGNDRRKPLPSVFPS